MNMPEVKYVRHPGMLIDLTFMYVLHYNRNLWDTVTFSRPGKFETDREYYEKMLSEFPKIPDDFLIFFYLKNDDCAFLTRELIYRVGAPISEKYDLEGLIQRLSDTDFVVNKMTSFYFPEESLDNVHDNYFYSKLIRESDYPGNLKFELFSFFVEPDRYIQKLIRELEIRYALVHKYYTDHSEKLFQFTENFSYIDYWETARQHPTVEFHLDENEVITMSTTLIKKFFSFCDFNANMIIIGTEYKDFIKAVKAEQKNIDLVATGKVFGEFNRIKILDYLSKQEERSTSEIAKMLALSLNATIYHLSSMIKAGVIKQRESGRTVYYRLNKDFFDTLCEELQLIKNGDYNMQNISKRRDNHEME